MAKPRKVPPDGAERLNSSGTLPDETSFRLPAAMLKWLGTAPGLNRDSPELLGDADLLTRLLAAAKVKHPPATANALLAEFGSFAEALGGATGMQEEATAYLATVRAAALRMLHGKIKDRPALSSWSAVVDYLRAAMAFEPREQFRVTFLDKRNHLIVDEVHQRGTIDHTPVYPRELVKRAIELDASAILIAHNHPSGDPTPSHADIEMTKAIIVACRTLGIVVHDHVVVGKAGHASFKALGPM